ncbi:MAG TPA: PAS domain-containing protein [Bacteroidia bacterium]|jgi:PAS domain S-box-containing protein|nr:PAS domain-containing protein [Bacteroidia bacterium]
MNKEELAIESNHRSILQRVSDAIVALDTKWRYTFLNDAALATHPLGREATLGKIIWDVHPDMLGTIFEEKYRHAMQTGEVTEVESFYPPMDIWFSVKIYPDKDGLTIIYKDVTAAKKTEEQIKASQQQLQLIYDSVSDPIFLIDVLPEHKYKIISINKAFTITTGLGAELIVDKLINDIIPEPSRQLVLNNYHEAIAKKKIVQWEETTPYPTGVKIGIVSISPILDKQGNCTQLLGVVHDITESKKIGEEIKASHQQLQLIYDSASDPLFLIDVLPEGKYKLISVNKAFTTSIGFAPERILNKLVNDIAPQHTRQMVINNYNQIVEKKQMMEWEETNSYPTGVRTGTVFVSPILDKEGNCVQLLGVVHDNTERKKNEVSIIAMNEQLRNLSSHLQNIREEERTRVAREIHDDLGQHLTGLKFALTALKNKNTKEFHLPTIEDSVHNMIDMVDTTIVSVRRIAKELRPGVLDDLGLEAAIEWQAKEYEERTDVKTTVNSNLNNHEFSKEINTAIFRIFQESFTNIIRHAQATNVNVNLFIEANNLVLQIIDNGVGISDERKQNNTSLGLLGMRERATYLSGTFVIEKQQQGGTSVTVTIPIKI